MPEKLVFISHVNEESWLAKLLSEAIKHSYLNMLDTFVSSDGDSIRGGERWVEKITSALEDSVVQLILCSPFSIHRPWINFEAGAAWIRRIPVIPICHSGLTKTDLPIPLSLLEACNADDKSDLEISFNALTKALGSTQPSIDYCGLMEKINNFSRTYVYYSKIHHALSQIEEIYPDFVSQLKTTRQFRVHVSSFDKPVVFDALNILKKLDVVIVNCGGMQITREDNYTPCFIQISPKLSPEKFLEIFS